MLCVLGFNKVFLASIGDFIKDLKGIEHYGVLVRDEMKARCGVDVASPMLEVQRTQRTTVQTTKGAFLCISYV